MNSLNPADLAVMMDALKQCGFEHVTLDDLLQAEGRHRLLAGTIKGLYVSLHTRLPRDAEDAELSYEGYQRQEAKGEEIRFPLCTGGKQEVVTHFGLGSTARGPGRLFLAAPLDRGFCVARDLTPVIHVQVSRL